MISSTISMFTKLVSFILSCCIIVAIFSYMGWEKTKPAEFVRDAIVDFLPKTEEKMEEKTVLENTKNIGWSLLNIVKPPLFYIGDKAISAIFPGLFFGACAYFGVKFYWTGTKNPSSPVPTVNLNGK